jgi:hypothetical protein
MAEGVASAETVESNPSSREGVTVTAPTGAEKRNKNKKKKNSLFIVNLIVIEIKERKNCNKLIKRDTTVGLYRIGASFSIISILKIKLKNFLKIWYN